MNKDLEKDLLNGRFSKEFPSLLMFGESEISGLEIFVVLDEIVSGKEEWPEKNLELIYSYTISGKGQNEEGKFGSAGLDFYIPEDTKEFMAKDIANFLEYVLKKL